MTQILKRALPFVVAFVLGVVITFVVGRVSVTSYRSHCQRTTRAGVSDRLNSHMVEVWELPEVAKVIYTRNWVMHSSSTRLTLKEQALVSRAERSDADFVVSYVSPEAVDGRGYTQNVGISNIPRPGFWNRNYDQTGNCNILVRVELDKSGSVSRAEPVTGHDLECLYLSDIVDAAKNISFTPALRDGAPVTVRMLLMYKTR